MPAKRGASPRPGLPDRGDVEEPENEIVLAGRRVLIIVENLPVPFDRRVWQEARTLAAAGAVVSVICPATLEFPRRREVLDGIHIYRHPLPRERSGVFGYLAEYSSAVFWQSLLSVRAFFAHGFDVIHACNPPDLIFLVALPYRLLGVKFLFDHHDMAPEFYEAKFGRRDFFWRLLLWCERQTFRLASVSIATNDSYREIAISRGGMKPEDVFVVRSGPDLRRIRRVPPNLAWKKGRDFLVGYVGVMGEPEGIDLLLAAVRHIVETVKRTDIQFVLVGGGPQASRMQELCGRMGVSEFVTFTGRASDDVLLEILSSADVCVNPDRVNAVNTLSTMNKILEYMALGKPIVQFEMKEGRVSAGGSSLYAVENDPLDLAAKMLHLIDQPLLRSEMGETGQERVHAGMSWESEAPKLLQAYRALFEKTDKRRAAPAAASR